MLAVAGCPRFRSNNPWPCLRSASNHLLPCSKKQSKNITSTSNKHINPTTIHNSYLKLNTTHGYSGHLEPEHPQLGCIHFLFTISNKTQRPEPSLTACAVSRFLLDNQAVGGGRRDRTDDLMLAKHALSQLSYAPSTNQNKLVGLGRLELPTSRLSGVRSNQLSYRPGPPLRVHFPIQPANQLEQNLIIREEMPGRRDLSVCLTRINPVGVYSLKEIKQ